jgi:hypothetical protein
MSSANTDVMSTTDVMPSEIVENLKTYMLSKDMEVVNDREDPENNLQESENNLQEPAEPSEQSVALKKYRARNYDNSDKEYATQMKKYEIPQDFRDFTEGLMDETHINRFGLLQAIEDFQRTRPEIQLSCAFQNGAFNCRPYQPCVIC